MQIPRFELLAFVIAITPLGFGQSPADSARMNQIRVLGSHNSYKQAIDPSLLTLLRKQIGNRVQGLEYSHHPIAEQLDRGLRALEIDVVNDPEGGLYAHPKGLDLVKQAGLPHEQARVEGHPRARH